MEGLCFEHADPGSSSLCNDTGLKWSLFLSACYYCCLPIFLSISNCMFWQTSQRSRTPRLPESWVVHDTVVPPGSVKKSGSKAVTAVKPTHPATQVPLQLQAFLRQLPSNHHSTTSTTNHLPLRATHNPVIPIAPSAQHHKPIISQSSRHYRHRNPR